MSCPPTCTIYELIEYLQKFSPTRPKLYNSFVLMAVLNGSRRAHERHVIEVSERVSPDVYLAAGHLVGNGPHNAMVEILSDDLDELLRISLLVSDFEGVVDVRVLRVDAADQRGMGIER